MKLSNSNSSYLLTWGAAFGLLGAGLIAAIWVETTGSLCAAEETSAECVREWIGALGGYVALLVAWVTLQTMNRQQKENLELQIRSRLALAFAADQKLYSLMERANRTKKLFVVSSDQRLQVSDDIYFLKKACEEIEAGLEDPLIRELRQSVGIFADNDKAIEWNIEICRTRAEYYLDEIIRGPVNGFGPGWVSDNQQQIHLALQLIEEQFRSWLLQTREFQEKWRKRIHL